MPLGEDKAIVSRMVGPTPVVTKMTRQQDGHQASSGHGGSRVPGSCCRTRTNTIHSKLLGEFPDKSHVKVGWLGRKCRFRCPERRVLGENLVHVAVVSRCPVLIGAIPNTVRTHVVLRAPTSQGVEEERAV